MSNALAEQKLNASELKNNAPKNAPAASSSTAANEPKATNAAEKNLPKKLPESSPVDMGSHHHTNRMSSEELPKLAPKPISSSAAAVIVYPMSHTSERQLHDFMTHCGKVKSIEFCAEDDLQMARVTFQENDPKAVETACLLSGSTIAVHPVTIVPQDEYSGAFADEDMVSRNIYTSERIVDLTDEADAHQGKSATQIVSDLMIAGYIKSEEVGQQIKTRAKAFDEKYGISAKAAKATNPAIHWAQAKMDHLNAQFHLKEKAAKASDAWERGMMAASDAVTHTIDAVKNLATSHKDKDNNKDKETESEKLVKEELGSPMKDIKDIRVPAEPQITEQKATDNKTKA